MHVSSYIVIKTTTWHISSIVLGFITIVEKVQRGFQSFKGPKKGDWEHSTLYGTKPFETSGGVVYQCHSKYFPITSSQ